MKSIMVAFALATGIFIAGSASAETVTTRIVLAGIDCIECSEFIYDLMMRQDGVLTVATNLDDQFVTISYDDKVVALAVLIAAFEMYGYYPEVLIQPAA